MRQAGERRLPEFIAPVAASVRDLEIRRIARVCVTRTPRAALLWYGLAVAIYLFLLFLLGFDQGDLAAAPIG
ncbi:hypothetical protein CHELA20_54258 [Hyphomicrobiales bacterium]|nr:hypothetical protein CHELA41_20668 [Hyphomicrobiales bacterium]CAH1685904.1 hypothetical protein CHELA20_54258 [Hyphomicrobiales bacterium]